MAAGAVVHPLCRRCATRGSREGGGPRHRHRQPSCVRAFTVIMAAVSLLAVLPAVLLAPAASAAAADEKVYLLNMMYSEEKWSNESAAALWTGVDAALFNSSYTTVGGRTIEMVGPGPDVDASNATAVVIDALHRQPNLLAAVGPFSDAQLAAVLNNSVIRDSGLMFMAPFTTSAEVREWNDAVYFTRAEPRTELMVILSHIINHLRARRVAFMYLTGVQFGEVAFNETCSLFTVLARQAPALYAVPYSATNAAVNESAFDAMADTRPQAVVVWGLAGPQVRTFIQKVLTDPRTSAASIFAPFTSQRLVYESYFELVSLSTIHEETGKIFSSATSNPPTDLSSTYMQTFKEQLNIYITTSGRFPFSTVRGSSDYEASSASGPEPADRHSAQSAPLPTNPAAKVPSSPVDQFFQLRPNLAQLMVAGWISGMLLQQTLNRPEWITSRQAYKVGLFNQNRYIIGGDYVLGDYGGNCSAGAAANGAVCKCNQGGHMSTLTELKNRTWYTVKNLNFSFPQSLCYSKSVTLSTPISILSLSVIDDQPLFDVGEQIDALFPLVMQQAVEAGITVDFAALPITTETAQQLFEAEVANYTLDIIAGPMMSSMDVGDVFVIDPLFPRSYPIVQKRNYVYLMPTLEQQSYVLYSQLPAVQAITSLGTRTHVVLSGYVASEVDEITGLFRKTAATFDVPDPTVAVSDSTHSLQAALQAEMINVLMGMGPNDAGVVAAFLATHPKAIVLINFNDLSINYDALVLAFSSQSPSVQARLVSLTNLPLWSDTSSGAEAASPLLALFHLLVTDPKLHVPCLLQALAVAGFTKQLMSAATAVNSTGLADTLYRETTTTTYGVTFGPYQWSCTSTTTGKVCSFSNFGASHIVMLSMQRMLDPTVPVVAPALTPSMIYKPRPKEGMTTLKLSAIIAGSVTAGVALMVGVALLFFCSRDNRDNDAAPKDGDEPVTLIFTDIESSTAMWAALPELMADAIAAHHRLIRQSIRKHGCYEVKTIGDSFMIACKDAYTAVRLACEVQTRLLEYDWGTGEIDRNYREFERRRAEEVSGYAPPTAGLGEADYDALWRGLRVRMGLHTGLSDIRYDEVTKGYDYYGDTSNMAARTEAIANGGQVVATETTWWALCDGERDAIAHIDLGPQGLRGVPYPVEMYQLSAVPGRRHAALRTEIEAILPDDGGDDTGSNVADALLSVEGSKTGASANVAFVMMSCFAPYPPAQRIRELQPLLRKWNVGAPPKGIHVSEEDYCQCLMNRLAVRIANITQVRQRLHNGESENSCSASLLGIVTNNPLGSRALGAPLRCSPSPGHASSGDGSPVLNTRPSPPKATTLSAQRLPHVGAPQPALRSRPSVFTGEDAVLQCSAVEPLSSSMQSSDIEEAGDAGVRVVRARMPAAVRRRTSRRKRADSSAATSEDM